MRASCLNSIFAKLLAGRYARLTTLVERKAVVLKRDDLTAELLPVERVRSLCRCRRDSGYARIPSLEGGEGKSPASICSISSIGHYSSSSVGRLNRPRTV